MCLRLGLPFAHKACIAIRVVAIILLSASSCNVAPAKAVVQKPGEEATFGVFSRKQREGSKGKNTSWEGLDNAIVSLDSGFRWNDGQEQIEDLQLHYP